MLRDKAKKLGKWSPCSRSCGGGVQFKEKTCSSVRYIIINILVFDYFQSAK